MELVLIRHGESLHNVRMSESFDSELTEKGRVQARLTGRELAGEGIEEIWCSPMKRALETASLIAGQLKIPVKVMVELSEFLLTLGEPGYSRSTILEKFPMVELPPEVDEEGWGRHRNSEQLDELRSRMKVVADRIQKLAQTEPEKKLALVVHGISGTELIKHLLHISFEHPLYLSMCNCGISRLHYDAESGEWIVFCINDAHHLGSLADVKHLPRIFPAEYSY